MATLGSMEVNLIAKTGQFSRAMRSAAERLDRFGQRVMWTGMSLGMLAGGPMIAAVKAAGDFEQKLIEIAKVTDQATAEGLSESLREMSGEIPVAVNALGDIAAQVGRLGVEGTENITELTEVISKFAIATEMSEQEAAESMARIQAVTKIPIPAMENLGSSINALANSTNRAATGITNASQRSAAALSLMGMSAPDIVALSTSLAEVSHSARNAGRRMRSLGQSLTDPEELANIADALGKTPDQLRAMRNSAPVEMIKMMARRSEELAGVLTKTTRQAVQGLAQNYKGLEKNLRTANEAFREGTSLQREFERAQEGFYQQLQLAINTLTRVGIRIGKQYIPMIKRAAQAVSDFIEENKWLADVLAGVLATATSTAVGMVTLGLTLRGIAGVMHMASAAAGGLNVALTALKAHPVWAAISAGVAAIMLLITAFGEWDTVIQAVKGALAAIGQWFQKMWAWADPIVQAMAGALGALVTMFEEMVSVIGKAVVMILDMAGVLDPIEKSIGNISGFFADLWDSIEEFVAGVKYDIVALFVTLEWGFKNWRDVGQLALNKLALGVYDIAETFLWLRDVIVGGLSIAVGYIEAAADIIKGAFKAAWYGMQSAFAAVVDKIIGGFESLVNKGVEAINSLIEAADVLPGVDIGKIGKVSIEWSGMEVAAEKYNKAVAAMEQGQKDAAEATQLGWEAAAEALGMHEKAFSKQRKALEKENELIEGRLFGKGMEQFMDRRMKEIFGTGGTGGGAGIMPVVQEIRSMFSNLTLENVKVPPWLKKAFGAPGGEKQPGTANKFAEAAQAGTQAAYSSAMESLEQKNVKANQESAENTASIRDVLETAAEGGGLILKETLSPI